MVSFANDELVSLRESEVFPPAKEGLRKVLRDPSRGYENLVAGAGFEPAAFRL
jgi:hypothetical protein